MHPFPHHYIVSAAGSTEGEVTLSSEGLTSIGSAPPAEFDGPGDRWSPETLLLASVADCFVLSFRAVATASKFEWLSLDCQTTGKLDRVERVNQFTEIENEVVLRIPAGSSEDTGRRLLEKAESVCLISNSLTADVHLEVAIEVER